MHCNVELHVCAFTGRRACYLESNPSNPGSMAQERDVNGHINFSKTVKSFMVNLTKLYQIELLISKFQYSQISRPFLVRLQRDLASWKGIEALYPTDFSDSVTYRVRYP